ncbi:MFS transporter [Gordonia humi]|uniref:MFS family permease n=1 Tax=Gordonia humi TaxID=686429 RepID=A0A840F5U3_9ACTN|nr:MFS transporter [Gordonia humi]MBB4134907.1 MFS family permease [Gordonia humi]
MTQASASPFKQPKAVWAVAFACVVSFMGIGLVDPILNSLKGDLGASDSQTTMLFTSYLVVTAVAMLITGWVSSRIGAKNTLIVGLVLIVVFAAAAGASGSIGEIIGFRAGWGVGNALFIATSLAVIVGAASGGFEGAIVLYETALGVGIATGPLIGGLLGEVSWRGPFFGVSVLMLIALVATVVLVEPMPKPPEKQSVLEPLKALRHRTLATTSVVGLLYNWGFFTILAVSPFLIEFKPIPMGGVFFGWGILVALFAVFGAPWMKARIGTGRALYVALGGMVVVSLVIGIWAETKIAVIIAVVASGIFVGLNNTLVTSAVMSIAPVPRPTASATYGFVRFIGGGLAPFAATKIAEQFTDSSHPAPADYRLPFIIGAVAVLLGGLLLTTLRKDLDAADAESSQQVSTERRDAEDAAREFPAVEEEAILAESAYHEDRVIAAEHDGHR